MLLALAGGQLAEGVMAKYQEYIVPRDVADWHGLPWTDALAKLLEMERIQDKVEGAKPRKVLQHFETIFCCQIYQLPSIATFLGRVTDGGQLFSSAI